MSHPSLKASFEFFPPATPEGMRKLGLAIDGLRAFSPEFFSVTYGAGGSTQQRTFEAVQAVIDRGLPVAPHLSCIGATRASIAAILDRYRAAGIRRLVALRGDLPSGMVSQGDLHYASDLVAFVREHSGDAFRIEVAGYPEVHPQAASPQADLEHLKRKVDAGSDRIITQYFYNADAYFDFVDRARAAGITVPIVPGIMPIMNYTQLARFSKACGAEIPRWIEQRLAAFHDDVDSLRAFGHDVVLSICERLVRHGADDLHFYTLNQAAPAAALWTALVPRPEPVAAV